MIINSKNKQQTTSSHEIPILRTIKYLYKNQITASRDFELSCINLRIFKCAYIVHILMEIIKF
ncbi:hypothetical protein COJ57_30905 [Bacillus cereus]|nr:hypothetical protein COJ57_30905 [Bacillus cereus]